MRKILRLKKRISRIKIFMMISIFIAAFLCTMYFCIKSISINLDNENIIKKILNIEEQNLDLKEITKIDFVFEYAFGTNLKVEEEITTPVINVEKEEIKPNVYIYNTHTSEKYSYESFEPFNINPTVVTASYILSEYLYIYNVNSIVEKEDVGNILNDNGWSYSKSYDASKILLENAYINNPTLNYFIDIHRDSAPRSITTTNINETSCIRFMFVVGKEHSNYEKNLEIATKINEELIKIDPTLTRGILEKEGSGVNGIYNQNFHSNTVLIEAGGQYNNIEEVNCGLVYLSEAIKNVLED